MHDLELGQKLNRLLLDLGDSANTVAAYLEGQGCLGKQGQPNQCPIAVYLQRQTGGHARAGSFTAGVYDGETEGAKLIAFTMLPPAVTRFIHEYDRNRYPKLVQR